VDRRSFIAYPLLVGASGCLAACSPRLGRAYPEGAEPTPGATPLSPWLDALLQDAARAPSSHNSQPWSLLLQSPKRWQMRLESSRRLEVVDPHCREAWISLGAFYAALETSAVARGLRLDLQGTGSASEGADTADIAIRACSPDTEWLASLRARRCLRRDLSGATVDARALQIASATDGVVSQFLPLASAEAQAISLHTVEAEVIQQRMEAVWKELADWVRWSASAEQANPTGITPAGMELPLLARLWVAATYGREDVVAPDFRLRSLQSCRQCVNEGAGWWVIATPGDDRDAWLAAGRCLMRVWLASTRMGLALHPMSQALEIPEIRERLAQRLGLGNLQMLIRIGKPPRMLEPVSPRLAQLQFAESLFTEGALH